MMIDRWIAEETECDFKVALEVKKPKSWLKSVSAFANGIGGTLFFGIDNDRNAVGLDDAQTDAEAISRLIKERITPYPSFVLAPEREDGKDILVLSVSAGRSTPYYYKADGIMEAYIRIGNESVIAPSYVLNQLILKGMHRTYDELVSEYDFKDYAFSKLRERYKAWTGNSMEEKLFDSFDMRDEHGKLTNAGALLADDSPIRHSRLFCTRWNGLDKSGGMVDALDSAEFSGIGEVRHAVHVLAGGQMVADLILIGLQMLRQGPEHEAAVDGIVSVDRFNLRDERFLRHVLRQDELLNFHADELCAGGRALFIGQVGGVLTAADDGKLRADALFLQSRDTRLQLFVHRSGNFLAKQ